LYDEYIVGSSLPVLLYGCIVLMGADGRGSRGPQGNGDSPA